MVRHKSKYIFGIHDPGGEYIMAGEGKKGWILFVHALGLDSNRVSGFNYSAQADQGFGIMARLNHGYEPAGTISRSDKYELYAQRCANWVRNSHGCHIWIIGNEMNYAVERPGVRYDRSRDPAVLVEPGEIITPEMYARCYRLCRDAIHLVPDHEDDEVLLGAVAPWNAQTTYTGNPQGDWIQYFQDILRLLGPQQCDGITLHTYTHGTDPHLVYTATKFQDPPFDQHHYDFLAYRDFMHAIPSNMRQLPVYITETDQDVEWKNQNSGWVQRAYGEIDWWNRQPGHQQILSLLLYRWPRGFDKWGIQDKAGVIEDFRAALHHEYIWYEGEPPQVYAVEWLKHNMPATMRGNATANVYLKLRNTGNNTWQHSGAHPVRLGFHWYKDGRLMLLKPEQDVRTPLPSDIAPGDELSVNATAVAPAEGGSLTLTWDLVEEGVTWFADKGADPLSLAVNVEAAPPPDEEYFEATKQWVRGLFLDFFRRYGLDITGYPISEQGVDLSSGLPTQAFQRVILEEVDGKTRLKLAGQDLQEARRDITRLEARIDELRKYLIGGGIMLPPSIQDVTEVLTRDSAGFYQRQPSHVRYLVINHSGLTKDIELERIAVAHQRRGWPGITYQFYIDRQGQIFRTNPDLEVVSPDNNWAVEGINICFAGHFSREIPNEAQLSSGGHLCAWLLRKYALTTDAIAGINEFYKTESPGKNWSGGANWREMLLTNVEEVQASARPASDADAQQIAALRSQVQHLQAQVQALLDQVALLQQENEQLRNQSGSGPVEPPPIQDITAHLPRDTADFKRRERSDIRTLVIHHTAVPPSVSMDRIAKSHKASGWPGTMHHYFVDGEGNVQQTNPLEEIVDDSVTWIRQAVNICFAGNFAQHIPSEKQLASGARLCAWLLRELDLSPDAVRGAKEFYSTQSPGEQWQEGRQWRGLLLQRVERLLESAGPAPGDSAALQAQIVRLQASLSAAQQEANEATAQRDQLQAQVRQLQQDNERLEEQLVGGEAMQRQIRALQAQVKQLQQENKRLEEQAISDDAMQQQIKALQAQVQQLQQENKRLEEQAVSNGAMQRQIKALQAQVQKAQERIHELQEALDGPIPGRVVVSRPIIQDIVDDLPKHDTLTYDTRPLEQITHISIHHSAVAANIDPWRVAAYQIKEDPSREKPAWPGIGYHYYMEPDGTIYQTNHRDTLSYHSGGNNSYTLGICFAGSFMDVIPTPKQIESGGHLIAWLMQELSIPLENVWGHQEYPKNRSTSCPGAQWLGGQKWKQILMVQAHAVQHGLPSPLDKPIRHYVLFWWRSPDMWAKSDWANARNYVAKFHPVCGFSEEAAKRAEYVLVVGGTAGVSWQTEHNLRQAGCNVERIEGMDEADTQRQLDELAASDFPFKTFDLAEPWWI